MIKKLPVRQETRVLSLGQEYPLEKEMVTHFSIFAWEIPWTEETGGLQSMGLEGVVHDCVTEHVCACTHTHTHTHTQLLLLVAVMLSDDALNTE